MSLQSRTIINLHSIAGLTFTGFKASKCIPYWHAEIEDRIGQLTDAPNLRYIQRFRSWAADSLRYRLRKMVAERSSAAGVYKEQVNDTIFIVDDEPLVLTALEIMLSSAGFKSMKFASARNFLTHISARHSGCALVDIRMPDMDGFALLDELLHRNSLISVIVMTGHADVSLAVQAMQRGALDILEKPIDTKRLFARVESGLAMARDKAEQAARIAAIEEKIAELSARERDILQLILVGHSNKAIARILGISSRTVEIHRARVMKKMNVESVVSLVRMTMDIVKRQ
jgi:RNA polymerase sigma factor (sigma-70 family)